jgi:uncharacterized membrane protein
MRTTPLLLLSLLVSAVVTGLALIIAIFASATHAGSGGISMVAGGLSNTFLLVLLIAFPLSSLAVFLMLRKLVERKR